MTSNRWRATVMYAATLDGITGDQADALMRHLPGYGLATSDGRHVRLEMTVEASTLRRATDEAIRAAAAAYADAFDAVGTPAGIRVITEEESERELMAPTRLDLVGFAEIGEMAEVSKQRAAQIAELAGFPAPVAEPRAGKMFLRAGVERFLSTWERRVGRPRKAA